MPSATRARMVPSRAPDRLGNRENSGPMTAARRKTILHSTARLMVLAWVCLLISPASAHFFRNELPEGTDAGPSAVRRLQRTVIVGADDDGSLHLYLRTPAPLVFVDLIERSIEQGAPVKSPFLRAEASPSGERYRLALDAIEGDEQSFRARLSEAIEVTQHGRALNLKVRSFRIDASPRPTPFATAEHAELSLLGDGVQRDPWYDQARVEVAYAATPLTTDTELMVASGYPEVPLRDEIFIDNLIIDERWSSPRTLDVGGQMASPVVLDGSWWSAFSSFVWQGILHILLGFDHVLFVICLALAATSRAGLVWMITGFSVGHSVTLIAGFLGVRPEGAWFITWVEILIALSILYAAWAAHRERAGTGLVTALIGLLHGFGFSFVLGEILGTSAESLISSLLAFNVGVELGQLAIIVVFLSALALLERAQPDWVSKVRTSILASIAFIAGYWVVERLWIGLAS
jgi:hypothetical protein